MYLNSFWIKTWALGRTKKPGLCTASFATTEVVFHLSLKSSNEDMLYSTWSCSVVWHWQYVLNVKSDREWSWRERNRGRVNFPNLGHVSHGEQWLKITTLFVKVFPLYWRQTITLCTSWDKLLQLVNEQRHSASTFLYLVYWFYP